MDKIRREFCEWNLGNEIRLGARQYLIFGAGKDSYATRYPKSELHVFEVDRKEVLEEKQEREKEEGLTALKNRYFIFSDVSGPQLPEMLYEYGYKKDKKAFASLWGISAEMGKNTFGVLLGQISVMMCEGSAICFDYDLSMYDEDEMVSILTEQGFLVYEDLTLEEVADRMMDGADCEMNYILQKQENIRFLLAVKKEHRRK